MSCYGSCSVAMAGLELCSLKLFQAPQLLGLQVCAILMSSLKILFKLTGEVVQSRQCLLCKHE